MMAVVVALRSDAETMYDGSSHAQISAVFYGFSSASIGKVTVV